MKSTDAGDFQQTPTPQSFVINLSRAKFQYELIYVIPVVFIKLDGTENYCLVSQWVGTESCNSSDNGNLTSAQLC